MSESSKRGEERRAKLVKTGVAVGIGSAAIVAALLYASKAKKPKTGIPPKPTKDE
nr:isopropylmalate isomerase [uncultured Sphingomonas sp.]